MASKMPRICFVTVGTTCFDSLITAINDAEVRKSLAEHLGITHLRIQYGRGTVRPNLESGADGMVIEAFDFKPTLLEEMIAASVIISHAGAGSVMESLSLGKPLIVVVNDALMDNHQIEIAEALERGNYLAYAPSPRDLINVIEHAHLQDLERYPERNTHAFAEMLDKEMGFN